MDELENKRQRMIKAFKDYNETQSHNRSSMWDDYLEAREDYFKAVSSINKIPYLELKQTLQDYD